VGTFSFLPWNKGAAVLDFNVGVFLVTAISSIGILGHHPFRMGLQQQVFRGLGHAWCRTDDFL
jgi:hypothetical protein